MSDIASEAESAHPWPPERAASPISVRPAGEIYPSERRDHASRAAIVRRISVEYEEMPGLRLGLAQAQRLFGIREDICVRVLNTLVLQESLRVDANGAFVRNGGRP